jgi:hypothetical protein
MAKGERALPVRSGNEILHREIDFADLSTRLNVWSDTSSISAALRRDYEKAGPNPSNLRYGYVNTAPDHTVFG